MNIEKFKKEVALLKSELFRNAKFILAFSLLLSSTQISFYLFLYFKSKSIAYHHILFFACLSLIISTLYVVSFEDEFEKPRRQGEIAFRLLMFLSLIYIYSSFLVDSTIIFFIPELFSVIFLDSMFFIFILFMFLILIFIISMYSNRLYVSLYNKFESFYIFANKIIDKNFKNLEKNK